MDKKIKIERKFATASHHTFTIKPIAELLKRYVPEGGQDGLIHLLVKIAQRNIPMTTTQKSRQHITWKQ